MQVVGADGAFVGLENGDALRPVLQRIYEAAGLSDLEADGAIERVEAAMVEEARTGWNLAVGFWIGAELDFGRAWEQEIDAPYWILPAVAVRNRVRMEARRRVPCSAVGAPSSFVARFVVTDCTLPWWTLMFAG